jgi:hypothetical protein
VGGETAAAEELELELELAEHVDIIFLCSIFVN